jgi:DNA modification methylase
MNQPKPGHRQTALTALTLHPDNPRHGDIGAIVESIEQNGWIGSLVAQCSTGHVLAGNHRMQAAAHCGFKKLPTHWIDCDDAAALRILLSDNRSSDLATNDDDILAELLAALVDTEDGLAGTGYDGDDLDELIGDLSRDDDIPSFDNPTLQERFGVPPFSILDTRQGYWQDRKRAWKALGIESEVGRNVNSPIGRDENLTFGNGGDDPVSRKLHDVSGGTSIFDPVLTEILIRWFCPQGGTILDPFAGGVVRGAVAARLGRQYLGIDTSERQITANRKQTHLWKAKQYPTPEWVIDDARNVATIVAGQQFDFVMTCPPYADLEQYDRDNPADLSNLHPEKFMATFADIIAAAASTMSDGSFMALVVSEVRNSKREGGPYLGIVPQTIQAMTDAGLHYYNELVLINAASTLPLRAGRQMVASRKIGRTHQNVLVAYKGDLGDIPILAGEETRAIEESLGGGTLGVEHVD